MFRRARHRPARQGEIEDSGEAGRGPGEGGRAAFAWGVAGVLALLSKAALSLGRRGLDTLQGGLEPFELVALVVLTTVFVYGEGVRALQGKWVPHVLGRLRGLGRGSATLHRVLAPLYGMGLIGAPRRMLVRAWIGVLAIIAAVLVVRAFPEPWRGIVDFAVAAALVWGCGAVVSLGFASSRGR